MTLEAIRKSVTATAPAQLGYRCAVTGRLVAERWSLSARRLRPDTDHARILAYHSVGTPEWGVNDVRPRDFERHLQIAADDGWEFGTPAQALAAPDRRLLAVTFDDGVDSVLRNAAPVLRAHGVPATMFVVTGWADGHAPGGAPVLDWRGLEALQQAGVALASHSVTHPDFGTLGYDEALRELDGSRRRMRDALGLDVDEFAIPFGQSRNWSEAVGRAALDAGYTTVYAQAVHRRPAGTVPRTFVTRIDRPRLFRAALAGCYDDWEEWHLR